MKNVTSDKCINVISVTSDYILIGGVRNNVLIYNKRTNEFIREYK